MCVVSMVHDHYDRLPNWPWNQTPTTTTTTTAIAILPPGELKELRKLIREFREAVAAAKKVDELTAQPDCVDPEKAKLSGRVAELEKQVARLMRKRGRK